jgi:tyrosyl-tRNA synthetase
MTPFQSAFLQESQARGFIYQGTDLETLDQKLCQSVVVGYIGFDATATSLHVGNLVQIMRLRLLQRTGHKPIVLIGDGTTRVGDPSGKDTQRQLLSEEQIEQNINGIEKIFANYLDFNEGPTGAILLRNYAWLKDLNYLQFLRDYGRHFSVNRMLSFDSVKARLDRDQPLSFLEFNYMILQGYDFLELNRTYDCTLQLGGADQWGNILNGIDLIRRVCGKNVFGITAPLITTADGQKMGKTAQGAVWLNADMLSPFEYWQFWRNTQDADVGRFLRLFTDLPLQEIAALEQLQGAELNEAKKILADEATRLCHGEQAVEEAHQAANRLFTKHKKHGESDLAGLMDTLPTLILDPIALETGVLLIDVIVQASLAESKGEARRLIRGGAIRLNDRVIHDEMYKVIASDFSMVEPILKLSAGKKRHALLKLNV